MNSLGKMMKCLPGGLVKPKGKGGKLERTTCTSKTELAKIHLNHLAFANNRHPLLPHAQGILLKKNQLYQMSAQ
jgi:hypothetical protein